MKKIVPAFLFTACVTLTVYCLYYWRNNTVAENTSRPSDWFFYQRSYPSGKINTDAYYQAVEQTNLRRIENRSVKNAAWGSWKLVGPVNVGGRITTVAMHASDQQIVFAGTASGGVFRSNDQGTTWKSVFDEQLSLSIGDLAIAPSDKNIIYVGTGEANGGGGSVTYDGNGIYKSTDGGNTWAHMGLANGRNTGKILVHPTDPNIVYTAQMGSLFADNPDRGIFKSSNGGQTWQKVLFVSDSTGGIDLLIHPAKPETLYAAMWERVRRHDRRSYGGISSGIYRSYDGGSNWTKLTSGLPSGANVGRIGIAISPVSPATIFAVAASNTGDLLGTYKSNNNGDSWTTVGSMTSSNYDGIGWWFAKIFTHPTSASKAYELGLNLYETTNGGTSWKKFPSSGVHVDQHSLYIHPQNTNLYVLGNDGGIYISKDAGANWTHVESLPITQFYACEVDYQNTKKIYGGAQDNHITRTSTGSVNDWAMMIHGDGFTVLVDPTNTKTFYGLTQFGVLEKSTNDGTSTSFAMSGIASGDRKNWSTPLFMHPGNSSVLYYGTQKVYKTTDKGASWTAISGDLTKGISPDSYPFATITALASAASDDKVVYAGTDDGKVWMTADAGANWKDISAGLPNRYVTRLAISSSDALTAYVTFSGYRNNETLAHVFKTTDGGNSWADISSNLPDAPVNDIILDPQIAGVYYLATDAGVYYTLDNGTSWDVLGDSLPNVPVTDLCLHNPSRYLYAATYGRSMHKYYLGSSVETKGVEHNIAPLTPYPNPFINKVTIRCSIKNATVEVYDLNGRKLKTLSESANNLFSWDGKDEKGAALPPGTYICSMKAPGYMNSVKIMLSHQ